VSAATVWPGGCALLSGRSAPHQRWGCTAGILRDYRVRSSDAAEKSSSYAPRIRRIDGSRRSAAAPTQTQPNQPPNLAYRVGEGELVGT
jgi:hypothetical protein